VVLVAWTFLLQALLRWLGGDLIGFSVPFFLIGWALGMLAGLLGGVFVIVMSIRQLK
jgi:hypothetical protein